MMKNGIDVSRFQGVIDWAAVKAAGVDFAIIKAGGSDAGLYTDSAFERNYEGAKAAGIPVGAYYYVGRLCISRADGIADAERFIEMLKGKEFEYPVFIDLEETAPKDKAGATEAVIAFCETMESAGYYCGIYASDISGFKDRLDISRLTAFDKWVANYSTQPKYVASYGMWQKSSKGRIAGIFGDVDIDEAYQDYPTIIKANGLNGFKKPEPPKKQIKVTVEYDDHIYSGLLDEQL
jgi:GH25 family lysozyme M1 (1,4-beta-N-acetylmuramidase)